MAEAYRIDCVLTWPAFAKDKDTETDGPTAGQFLPPRSGTRLMLVCVSAAGGDRLAAAEWYENMALSNVYEWLAVRMAEAKEAKHHGRRNH